MNSSIKRPLLSLLTGVIVSIFVVGVAFAWTYLGNFTGNEFWSPNSGEKWAQFADDGARNRYLDVEAFNFYYSSDRISTMSSYNDWTSIVYHVFRRDTNCYVNMTATGYWWTRYPNPMLETKKANCSGENYSGKNEARIWNTNIYALHANSNYYAGAEYKDRQLEAGGSRLSGEMNYDAYRCAIYTGGCKTWMSKFYFNGANQFQ